MGIQRLITTHTHTTRMSLAIVTTTALSAFSPLGKARAPTPKLQQAATATTATTEFCYGLPGNIAPAGDFDPANLLEGASKEQVYRYREAELTHGRVGMLAAAGFLVQENFHPLFTADGGPAIEQIPNLPPALWFIMTLGIGICETLRIQVGVVAIHALATYKRTPHARTPSPHARTHTHARAITSTQARARAQ